MDWRKLFRKKANEDSTEYDSTDKHPRTDIVSDSASVCPSLDSASEPSTSMPTMNRRSKPIYIFKPDGVQENSPVI